MLENYKDSLFNDKIILKSQQTFKSQLHNVYTIEINKIALSNNDDKRDYKNLRGLKNINTKQMYLKCVKANC